MYENWLSKLSSSHHIVQEFPSGDKTEPELIFLGERHKENQEEIEGLEKFDCEINAELINQLNGKWTVYVERPCDKPVEIFSQTEFITKKFIIKGWENPFVRNLLAIWDKKVFDLAIARFNKERNSFKKLEIQYQSLDEYENLIIKHKPKNQKSLCKLIGENQGPAVFIAGRKHFNLEACKRDNNPHDHSSIKMLIKAIEKTKKAAIILEPIPDYTLLR